MFVDLRDASGIVQIVLDPSTVGDEVHRIGREWVLRVEGDVRARPEGTVNHELPTGAVEVERGGARGAERGRAAAVPARGARRRRRRGAPPAAPLPRPAPPADAAEPALAGHGQRGAAHVDGRAGLRRDRDADAHRVDARGRARLRRAVAAPARRVLRAAAEPAAVQAAPDGRRARPVLPDRAVPARRGPPRGPAVRVHAVRRGDVLRRARRTSWRW